MNEIRRYDNDEGLMIRDSYGKWVDFTDHERVVGHYERMIREFQGALALRRLPTDEVMGALENLRTTLAASRAEVEGLKKDAERYRWLRENVVRDGNNGVQFDSDIDAAMKEQAE